MSRTKEDSYKEALYRLHVELVKLQRHVIEAGEKVLLLLEGRDAAGKDGAIKRITRHMSPRETRVYAPAKPNEREETTWYFQRFVPHLPAAGELVLFNRSWYNRAGVERVMGFATDEQVERFLVQVPKFEELLVESGITLVKLYLDISRQVQVERLDDRRRDPLKQWKISPVDQRAVELWDPYTEARDVMLERTHSEHAPWTIVDADDKRAARLEIIRSVLATIDYPGRDDELARYDRDVVFPYDERGKKKRQLAS